MNNFNGIYENELDLIRIFRVTARIELQTENLLNMHLMIIKRNWLVPQILKLNSKLSALCSLVGSHDF